MPRSGNAARAPLVEGPSCSLERQIPSEEEGRFYDRDRCVKAGLGRILQWGKIRGNLVPSRTPSAHQLPRPYGRCLIAIKSFCKNKASIQVKLLMDNTTAISYINKMEGLSPVLASLVYEIWQWCLQRKIYLSAQHIPGILNYAADQESRVYRDSSDWKLDPTVFACLNSLWGPLEMDLFATRLTNQLPRFVSWRPDLEAEATDAFSQDWSQIRGYAFPPAFSLVGRCLSQLREQNTQRLCLITPVWEAQTWYPLLLEMSIDFPRMLPTGPMILSNEESPHPLPSLQLAGWLVSDNTTLQWEFQSKLKTFSSLPGVTRPLTPMSQLGVCGVAGVANNKLIHFLPLFTR